MNQTYSTASVKSPVPRFTMAMNFKNSLEPHMGSMIRANSKVLTMLNRSCTTQRELSGVPKQQ